MCDARSFASAHAAVGEAPHRPRVVVVADLPRRPLRALARGRRGVRGARGAPGAGRRVARRRAGRVREGAHRRRDDDHGVRGLPRAGRDDALRRARAPAGVLRRGLAQVLAALRDRPRRHGRLGRRRRRARRHDPRLDHPGRVLRRRRADGGLRRARRRRGLYFAGQGAGPGRLPRGGRGAAHQRPHGPQDVWRLRGNRPASEVTRRHRADEGRPTFAFHTGRTRRPTGPSPRRRSAATASSAPRTSTGSC